MTWNKKLDFIKPVDDIKNLPDYAFQFFLRNMSGFRAEFILLTLAGASSAILRFAGVYILSRVISNITQLSLEQIFFQYIPVWLIIIAMAECLDFFLRKYAEALPIVYTEYTTFRFYLTFLKIKSNGLFNFSKEKLMILTGKYTGNIQAFLQDWVWGITSKVTKLVIVMVILFQQSRFVFTINIAYMLGFLCLALFISKKFASIQKKYSQQVIETQSTLTSFVMNFNSVKRLNIIDFFSAQIKSLLTLNWETLSDVRSFHAKRWLLQLNLFNLLYIGTISYGIYQVKQGILALGFLVLIKWAFDELWHILVYIIEYYVALVQQKQDAIIIREEINKFSGSEQDYRRSLDFKDWQKATLTNVKISFSGRETNNQNIEIKIPNLEFKKGDKIGIIGQSGAGKTSLLNILLNLSSYEGSYKIDDQDCKGAELPNSFITIIGNNDPLFKLSLRDNILLGKSVDSDKVQKVLEGTLVNTFTNELSSKVGSQNFNLSAGQEQRVRLARGLLQDSEIFLLDEPFNGIDDGNKKLIMNFLKTFLKDKTVVLVTHNKEELELVDKIYEINEGLLQASA